MSLVFAKNTRGFTRVAVVVSKKVEKSAVGRNRIRRRVYEALRINIDMIPKKTDYIFVIYSKDVMNMRFTELEKELGELVEGCRQEVKTFDIMLSRNAARFPINKKDMIPANLHKAIEVLRKLTTGEATLDQTEIALDLIGYTYDSLAASVGKLAIDIG